MKLKTNSELFADEQQTCLRLSHPRLVWEMAASNATILKNMQMCFCVGKQVCPFSDDITHAPPMFSKSSPLLLVVFPLLEWFSSWKEPDLTLRMVQTQLTAVV